MEKVRGCDLTISIMCFLQGSVFMTEYVSEISGTQAWVPMLAAIFASIVLILVCTSMTEKYSGKNLIDINKEVLGKPAGAIMSWLYIFFFLSQAALHTAKMGYLYKEHILPDTPFPIIIVLFMAVVGYGAEKGIVNLMRTGFVFFWIIFTVTVVNYFLLIKDMDVSNFLPLFTKGAKNYLKGGYTILMSPFLEVVVFFMFTDRVRGKTKKSFIKGLVLGELLLFFVVVRDILVLGITMELISVQTFETLRILNVANILTRVDNLFAFLLLMAIYFKVTLLLCAVIRGICQLTGVQSRGLTYSVAALTAVYALRFFDSGIQGGEWGTDVGAHFSAPFELLLPLVTFTVMKLRGRKKECLR